MRRLLQTAALLAALAAAAASSPIAGTNDFTFTRVTYTNISGTVMGDAGDYRAMRYEDLAWLQEAVEERLAFTGDLFDFTTNAPNRCTRWEFGRWDADATNGTEASIQAFVDGMTQTVARAWAVTNLFLPRGVRLDPAGSRDIGERVVKTGLLAGLFSSPTNELVTSPTVGMIQDRYNKTSVVDRTDLVVSVTQRLEFVRHSLTNGTEEVHTNKVYYLATNSVRHVSTNYWNVSALDLCAKSGRFAFTDAHNVGLSGLFRSSSVTDAYRMVREADRPVVNLYATNAQLSSVSHAHKDKEYTAVPTESDPWDGLYMWDDPWQSSGSETFTNGTLTLEVSGRAFRTRKTYRYLKYDNLDGEELKLDEVVDENYYLDVQTPIAPDGLHVRAPFRLSVVTAGGRNGSPRVAGGDFFLVASVNGSVERLERGETTVEMAVTNAVAIVPVSAEIDLGGDPRDMAVFRVGGDLTELLWTAADAAGIRMPTSLGGLDAPSPPPLGDDEVSATSGRYYDLTVAPQYVIGVLRLDPTTKLEGW